MATQQEVLEIVTEFMLNAPPGEFLDVVHDIRRLISDERLLNATALPTFREYNLENMLRVVVPVLGEGTTISPPPTCFYFRHTTPPLRSLSFSFFVGEAKKKYFRPN